jgi:hypothetical protein
MYRDCHWRNSSICGRYGGGNWVAIIFASHSAS